MAQCRQRLDESHRERLASLEMCPDVLDLGNVCQAPPNGPVVNAVGWFAPGLVHDNSYLEPIAQIVRQAQAA